MSATMRFFLLYGYYEVVFHKFKGHIANLAMGGGQLSTVTEYERVGKF